MNIQKERDIEILRQAATLLESENTKLIKRTIELERENLVLKGRDPKEMQLRLAALEAELQKKNKALFGPTSEKQSAQKSSEEKNPATGHGPRQQPKLAFETVVYKLDEADRPCPECGGHQEEWAGQFEKSEEVEIEHRHYFVRRNLRQKYKCACGHIETALGPEKLQPGGHYSVNFAVGVAIDKYLFHLPLERQVRMMALEGLSIDSQTLWDQIERLGRWLQPVYQDLCSHILQQSVIGMDETHWRMLSGKESSKRWQVWASCTENAVAYQILPSRSAEAAKAVLGNFSGLIMCDGYAVYDKLAKQNPKLRIAHCLAHARRKFIEAQDDFPTEANEALGLIGELYAVEREAQGTGPPETLTERRRALREEKSRDIMQRLQSWAVSQRVLPESSIGKAIAYLSACWRGLQVYLSEPELAIDNNATERALRGIVVGRKNHYGSKSQRGTEVAALFYSLIESCKLNGVDPRRYLSAAVHNTIRHNGEPIPLPHDPSCQLLAEAQAPQQS